MDFVRETGRYPGSSFGSDACKIIFGAFEATYRDGSNSRGNSSRGTVGVSYAPNFAKIPSNASTDGAPFDVLVSTTDANELQTIDPVTLEPIELFTYEASHKLLVNSGHSAAHPVVGEDGTIYNYVLDRNASTPTHYVIKISPPCAPDCASTAIPASMTSRSGLWEQYSKMIDWNTVWLFWIFPT